MLFCLTILLYMQVIVDLIVQFCCQFESPIVFGMSSGEKCVSQQCWSLMFTKCVVVYC